MKHWIGIDLDGTLAHYDGWKGPEHIGEPIPGMVENVKQIMAMGLDVKIFTARVSSNNPERLRSAAAIEAWTAQVFGQSIPATAEKDYGMIFVYDDRSLQVLPNTGKTIIEGLQWISAIRGKLAAAEDPNVKGFFHIALDRVDQILEAAKRIPL